MTLTLTATQRRLLAVLLALAVVSTAMAACILPALWFHQRYDNYIESYSDRIQRYRRVAANIPHIEQALKGAAKRDSNKLYLKSASPTLASAELQGLLTKIIEANQGKVLSSQVVPQKDDAKTQNGKVSVSVQLGAATTPFQVILYTLETNEPHLFIDQISITSNQGRTYRPIPGVQPEFSIQLTAHAYMAPGSGSK